MEQTATLLVWTTNNPKAGRSPALEEILFTPAAEWVTSRLNDLEFDNLAVHGGSDPYVTSQMLAPVTKLSYKEVLDWLQRQPAETILVLGADAPLIRREEIIGSLEYHKKSGINITLFASEDKYSTGAGWYGRDLLCRVITSLGKDFSLYQLYQEVQEHILSVGRYWVEIQSILPADSSINRARLTKAASLRVIKRHLYKDVDIPLADGVMISPQAVIGAGTQILPGTIIKGETVIGEHCTIGPNSVLENVEIGKGTDIISSHLTDSTVEGNTTIGPMSRVRPGSHIGREVKIGNFVEVKNSQIGDETAISHLTYVGDSDVGKKCNLGCGVVTVNYDGKDKHRTTIGDGVFVGCNCNLMAPVTLEDGSFAAAGTTVTQDVPADSLVIGRTKDTIKKDWVKNRDLFDKEK